MIKSTTNQVSIEDKTAVSILAGIGAHFTALKTYLSGSKVSVGGQSTVITTDIEAQQTLSSVLKELKIMNIHLGLITGESIKKTEVE